MDINNLTIGELAEVERLAGMSLSAFGDPDKPQMNLMAALVYVIKKREDHSFTFNKALALGMNEITGILGLNDDEDEDPKDEN